jgi:hypothetical protein
MGRTTPDPPRYRPNPPPAPPSKRYDVQGRPKPVPPRRRDADVGGLFKCAYCARYGPPGVCAGCGAPNAPAASQPHASSSSEEAFGRVDVTTFGDLRRKFIDCDPPVFEVVKR